MSKTPIIAAIEREQNQKAADLTKRQAELQKTTQVRTVPFFEIGDTVDVHFWIETGEKGRIQVFNGTVIGRRGDGLQEMFTVRRIVQGEGVERVFPLSSPRLYKIDVKRSGKTRRAKLYYLRDRVGKKTKLKERKPKKKPVASVAAVAGASAGEAQA